MLSDRGLSCPRTRPGQVWTAGQVGLSCPEASGQVPRWICPAGFLGQLDSPSMRGAAKP